MADRKIMSNFNYAGFFRVLIPFILTQFLGVYAAYKFLPMIVSVQPAGFSSFSFYDYLFLVIFAVAFIFLASRFQKFGSVFYKVFLTFLVFAGVQAMLGIWFSVLFATLISVLLIILFWSLQNVLMQNVVMILTIAGMGAILGISLLPAVVLLVLVIFSFYDIIAVYKTGHMIKMAEAMIRSRAIFGFIIPSSFSGWGERLSRVIPGEQFMILGSGDVIFPLLLSSSLVRISLVQAVVVAIFSAAGLFLMYWLFGHQRVRRPMAALPPIAATSVIGYLVASLLFK